MPCHDPRDSEERDTLTRMLCTACSALEHEGILDRTSEEVVAWYERHKVVDQETKQPEKTFLYEIVYHNGKFGKTMPLCKEHARKFKPPEGTYVEVIRYDSNRPCTVCNL
jgi:hypothetical protein